MKPRAAQLLGFYSSFRGSRPTVLQALARQPPLFWAFTLVALIAVATYFVLVGDKTAYIFLGIVLGALARDIGWLLRFRRDWPTLDRVLDWNAVDRELSK